MQWIGITSCLREPRNRRPKYLIPFLDGLAANDITPDPLPVNVFLSGPNGGAVDPCTLSDAEALLSRFPRSKIKAMVDEYRCGRYLSHDYDIPSLLRRVAEWPLDNPDRLEIMKRLLDGGVDPNEALPDYGGISAVMHQASALNVAVERHDLEMAKALVERGAKSIPGFRGKKRAEEVARESGNEELAKLLESISMRSLESCM